LNVRYRDFAHAMPFALQVLMYASPVVYATELVPERFRFWFWLNPLTGAIEGMRSALLGGAPGLWAPFAVSAAMAAVLFVSGAYFFRRLERSFADTL
jgi:lipopolysaccharide transport system permease protein